MSKQLYQAVSSGIIRYQDLNDEGKKAYNEYKKNIKPPELSNFSRREPVEVPKPRQYPTLKEIVKNPLNLLVYNNEEDTNRSLQNRIAQREEENKKLSSQPAFIRALNRPAQTAADLILYGTKAKEIPRIDTGSKIGNVAADFVGMAGEYLAAPAAIGLPSSVSKLNILGAPAEDVTRRALTNVKTTGKVGQLAQRYLPTLARGAAEDAAITISQGLTGNENLKDIAKRVAVEAPTGAVTELGAEVIPDLLKSLTLKKIEKPKVTVPELSNREVAATAEQLVSNVKPQKVEKRPFSLDNIKERAKEWRDRSVLGLKRETPERVFEDVMGKDAPAMIDTYIAPVKASEANRIRFLNQERSEIKALGIKPRSADSKLVQQYGEGLISLDDLKKSTPNWQKIEKASNVLRGKYDSYLEEINKALARNGYDPIPKRKDYFRHFTEINSFIERFGIPVRENKLPTDINGLTADFKPGKNFFANALQRKTNITDYDAIQGIDGYLDGASKLIYHTDNIKRLRELDKTIRQAFAGTDHLSNFAGELTEYTNNLAGKKAMIDRALGEGLVGRKVYGVIDKIRKQVGANMIGANVSSAMTNYIPLTQAAATTDKPSFVRGMMETMANTFKDDGFIDKSDFLTRRVGSKRLSTSFIQKGADKANWLFKVIDGFTAQTVVRSKYLEGIKQGLAPEKAIKRADDWAARMMADRSLGSLPTLFTSKTLGVLTQFQLEVNNQLSFMFKDIPKQYKLEGKSKAAMASAIGQLFVYGYIFNDMFEKATGRRPAFDPIGVIQQAYNDYTDPNKADGKATENLIENIADQLPFSSIVTGGRIPILSPFPDIGKIKNANDKKKAALEEAAKAIPYALPTGGAQIGKAYKGLATFGLNPLAETRAGKFVYPKVTTPTTLPGVYGEDSKGEKYLKYPVEKNVPNIARGVLFGPSSFPETQAYYDNNTRSLSSKQTAELDKQIRKGKSGENMYKIFMLERKMNKLEDEKKEIGKSSISRQEKSEQVKKLNNDLRELNRRIKELRR
jgi:hypothetical protein